MDEQRQGSMGCDGDMIVQNGWSLIMVDLGSLFLSHGVVLDFYFIFLSC